MTHDQATGLWIPTVLLGVVTTGIGVSWGYSAARLHTCKTNASNWCLREGVAEGVSKQFFIIAGVLTAIAASTTTAVYLYRRKHQ